MRSQIHSSMRLRTSSRTAAYARMRASAVSVTRSIRKLFYGARTRPAERKSIRRLPRGRPARPRLQRVIDTCKFEHRRDAGRRPPQWLSKVTEAQTLGAAWISELYFTLTSRTFNWAEGEHWFMCLVLPADIESARDRENEAYGGANKVACSEGREHRCSPS